jgi:MFS family permease
MNSIAQIPTSSGAKHSRHFVKIVAAIAALAGLLFGFDTGVISGAILFIKGDFGLTPFTEELLVSAALVGAVCGSILSGRLTDRIGRKRAILITAGIFAFGSILCAMATSTGVLILGRIAIGLAIGGDLRILWLRRRILLHFFERKNFATACFIELFQKSL